MMTKKYFTFEDIRKKIKIKEITDGWHLGAVKITAPNYKTEILPYKNEVREDCYFYRNLSSIFYQGVEAALAVVNNELDKRYRRMFVQDILKERESEDNG